MTPTMFRSWRLWRGMLSVSAVLIIAALAFFAWQYFYPVQSASGWRYRVVQDDIEKAAGLAVDPAGGFFVSRELAGGKGDILRIAPEGTRHVIVDGLSKPDGLVAVRDGLVFSQEGGRAPVSLLRNEEVIPLFEAINAQGMLDDGEHLYVVEDRKGDGRLIRYHWDSKTVEVLRNDLWEAESIVRCPDGSLFYTEKEEGVVKRFREEGADTVFLANLEKPSFLLCDEKGLWISEDRTHRAELLLVDATGATHVVLSFLKAPQMLLPIGKDRYLLAEGGRDRVLELERFPD